MEEKPKRKVGLTVLKLFLVFAFTVYGIAAYISGQIQIQHYRLLDEKAVELSARITYIFEYEDSEGDTQYTPYIGYEYGGESYSRRAFGVSGSSAKVGDVVTIWINPDDPLELVDQAKHDAKLFSIFGSVFFAVAALSTGIRTRFRYCDSFGVCREHIHLDLMRHVKSKRLGLSLLVFAAGLTGIAITGICGVVMYIFILLFAALAVKLMIEKRRTVRAVAEEEYTVGKDRLVDKKIATDSDNDKVYHLYYKNDKNEVYTRTASWREYDRAVIGEEVTVVYLLDKKEPYLSFR